MGYVSDNYLHKYFEKNTKNKFHGVFQDTSLQLKSIEKDILKSLQFVSQNTEIIASLNLINNYEDISNYDSILFDEEKKRIIKNLKIEGKYSTSNHISIYDSKYKLVAYIDKEEHTEEHQGFVSYEDSKPVYYYKKSFSNEYKVGKHPKHFETIIMPSSTPGQYRLQVTNVEYTKTGKELVLKSDIAIFRTFSNSKSSIVGYVKAYNIISSENLNGFLSNSNITLSYNFGEESISNDFPILFSQYDVNEIHLSKDEDNFFSSVNIPFNEGFLLLTAKLDRSEFNEVLNKSQTMLIGTLLLIILGTLIVSLIILNKMISMPFKTLLNGIRIISNGDYSKQILLSSNDELGTISNEFNKMALKIAKRELELDELAYLDLLTQMPNRMMFTKQLEIAISRAKRNNNNSIAVLFLDLDEFKIINDTLGHNVGDELLIEVSKRLLTSMRKNDLVARIGGDEFNILIEDVNDPMLIEEIAQKIINNLIEPFKVEDHSMHVTISIGVAIYPDDGEDNTTLIKNADLAMYHAKESGKNQYKFFSKKLEHALQDKTMMLRELKQAVENNEFKLFYQPKFSLKDGSINTIEALVRWENKKLGFVMPDQFIPLSESSGEIINMGAWIMHQACSDLAKLEKLKLNIRQVSVNVSNKQFAEGNMVELIHQSLKSSGISPESLEIEMTESYIHDHTEEAIETLHKIREIGVDLAIDDFGTGYSSMSYLKKLPLSRLKIDKSFIDDIPEDSEDVEITKVIIALAKVLGLSITAEGIETAEQMRFLEELECDEGQGYICSKPLPYEELVKLLKSNHNCKITT